MRGEHGILERAGDALGQVGEFFSGIAPRPGEGGFAAAKGASGTGAFQPFEKSRPRMRQGERPINISERLPVAGSEQVAEAERRGLPFAPTRLSEVRVEGEAPSTIETLTNMLDPEKAVATRERIKQKTIEEQERRVAAANAPSAPDIADYSEERLVELAGELGRLGADPKLTDPVTADRLRVYSHNLRLIAENRAKYDRFAPIAVSNALALVGDPYAQLKREVNLIEQEGGVPSVAEQASLGVTPAPIDRPFDVRRDLGAAALGQLPAFAIGGALGRALAGTAETAAAGTRFAGAAGRLARIAEPIETPVAGAGAGRGVQRVARLARGVSEGQIVGAGIEAAKAAQSESGSPAEAALGSLAFGAALGGPAEVLLGEVADVGRIATGRIGSVLDAHLAGLAEQALRDPRAVAAVTSVDRTREGVGRLPLSDQTPDAQLREIGVGLDDLLARRTAALREEATAARANARTQREQEYRELFGRTATGEERPAGPEWWQRALPPEGEEMPDLTGARRALEGADATQRMLREQEAQRAAALAAEQEAARRAAAEEIARRAPTPSKYTGMSAAELYDELAADQLRLEEESNRAGAGQFARQQDDGSVITGRSREGGRAMQQSRYAKRRIDAIERELRKRGLTDEEVEDEMFARRERKLTKEGQEEGGDTSFFDLEDFNKRGAAGAAGGAILGAESDDDQPSRVAGLAGLGVLLSTSNGRKFVERTFSRLGRAIERAPFERGTAEQWAAAISKDVAKGEREWTGIGRFLADRAGRVLGRDEVRDAFEKGRIRLGELVREENPPANLKLRALDQTETALMDERDGIAEELRQLGIDPAGARRGGEEFDGLPPEARSLLERSASIDRELNDVQRQILAEPQSPPRARYGTYTVPGGENYREILLTGENDYRSPHFDEPGILAHARVKDRDLSNGEKALFVEEIQSDLHQAGRKRGYLDAEKQQRAAEIGDELEAIFRSPEYADIGNRRNDSLRGRIQVLQAERDRLERHAVPDVPFKKTDEWMGLALKRLIDEAVEGDYDRIAWTTGDQQAARYDLARQVGQLTYDPATGELSATDLTGRMHAVGKYGARDLPDVIGKGPAERLLAADAANRVGLHVIRGDDLKVGGEGMRSFYDRMVPKWLREYGKKLGVKIDVEDATIDQPPAHVGTHTYVGPELTDKHIAEAAARLRGGGMENAAGAGELGRADGERIARILEHIAQHNPVPADRSRVLAEMRETFFVWRNMLAAVGGELKDDMAARPPARNPSIRITPELKAKIKKFGQPLLAVAAAASLPDEANAQDGTSGPGSLYGTVAGGAIAGAALAYLATNSKARRLLRENRALRRELLMDAKSGLASDKALHRAIPSIDADPEWRWIVLDGDQFKRVNDMLGHAKGDEALRHFGQAIMDVAKEHDVPMRGFRNTHEGGEEDVILPGFRGGGDEFSFAVPVEKAAAVLHSIEERSALDLGQGVTTRLTGSIGDTWEAADLAANAVKEVRRVANPELRRKVEAVGERKGVTLYSNPIGPALEGLRRYPSSAGLALLGAALSDSDDPLIERTGIPVLALAGLHAIGGKSLLAGRDELGGKLVGLMAKTAAGKGLVRALNPDALLSPEVRQAILAYEGTVARGRARAREFSGMAERLGPEADRAVSDVIEGEGFEDVAGMGADDLEAVFTVAAQITEEMDALGARKVESGVIAPAQRDKYAGRYLPRRYAEWDALDVMGEQKRQLAGGRKKRIGAQRSRQDVSDEGRNALGEIREASYRTSGGIEKGYRDVAAAELFHTLRNSPGVIHPEFQSALDDFLAAKELFRAAESQSDQEAAVALLDEAKVAMDAITRQFEATGGKGEYVSLPNSKGLGVLRGMVVQRDVANSLNGLPDVRGTAKLLRWWKEAHTVFNPGTHLGNVAGNVSMAHLAGMNLTEQPYWLARAAKDLRGYGEGTRALAEAGILDVNAVTATGAGTAERTMRPEQRLESLARTTRPETRRVLLERGVRDTRRPSVARKGARAAGRAADAVRNLYNNEDNIFRVAMYLKARAGDTGFSVAKPGGMGKTAEAALALARDSFGDFRTRSPAIRFLRGTGLAPFILWPTKVLPKVAQNIVDHPWRYMTLVAGWAALDQYSQSQVGAIDERDVSPRDRRELGYFLPGLTQLPFRSEDGARAAFDIARFTPLSALTTAAPPGTAAATIDEDYPAILSPSGPWTDLAAKVVLNRDPFTGDEIVKKDYPRSENIARMIGAVLNEALPPALGFHRERITRDVANRDLPRLRTDILGPFGLRPRHIRPGIGVMRATLQLRESMREMKADLARSLRRSKSAERNRELVERYTRRIQSAVENYRERVGADAPIPGPEGSAQSRAQRAPVDLDALFTSSATQP